MTGRSLAERLELLVITDPGAPIGVSEAVRQALRGGATAIQLRWKDAASGEMLQVAEDLREQTREAGALFFVNDRLDVALAVGADGVHLGDDDLPVAVARRLAPPPFFIGRSVDDAGQAAAAVAEGADYVGFGPIYQTSAKTDTGAVVGPEGIAAVRAAVTAPIVAIGGIAQGRAAPVIRAGADGVAIITAIMLSPQPLIAARELSEEIQRELGRHRVS